MSDPTKFFKSDPDPTFNQDPNFKKKPDPDLTFKNLILTEYNSLNRIRPYFENRIRIEPQFKNQVSDPTETPGSGSATLLVILHAGPDSVLSLSQRFN